MPLFSWFSKKSPAEDYEQVLASLALSIQKRQTRLSELRLRERRATLFVTTWTFAAWAGYIALWWAGIIGVRGQMTRSVGWGLPVVVGPVIILFNRRVVQLWYMQKGNAEEKTLEELLVKQRKKIEEIKKKTNYYSTKSLLDRYDEGPTSKSGQASASQASQVSQRRGAPQAINTQHPPSPTPFAMQTPVRGGQQQQPLANTSVPNSPALPPLPPPQKQWYDKLADALLGDDTASTGASPSTRYALICERCFSHNGLVKEEHWEDAQYLCPKCGHFNQSVRTRKALRSPTTPQSAASAASAPQPTSSTPPAHMPVPQHQAHLPSPNRPHEKSPLSESTVIVEKSDADADVAGKPNVAVGYDVERMEVDS